MGKVPKVLIGPSFEYCGMVNVKNNRGSYDGMQPFLATITTWNGGASTSDLGTVVRTSWNEVTINWDDGHTASIQHNDMARVERVPRKLNKHRIE